MHLGDQSCTLQGTGPKRTSALRCHNFAIFTGSSSSARGMCRTRDIVVLFRRQSAVERVLGQHHNALVVQPLHDAVAYCGLPRRCSSCGDDDPSVASRLAFATNIDRTRRHFEDASCGDAPATPMRKGSDLHRRPLRAVPGGETPCRPASTVALQLIGCRFKLATPLLTDPCAGSVADMIGLQLSQRSRRGHWAAGPAGCQWVTSSQAQNTVCS